MPSLLHLTASARRDSFSRRVGGAFADAWREAHPDGSYVLRDVAADPVPHITEAWTELCDHALAHQISDPARLHEGARTPSQREAWAVVEPLLDELLAADVVLIATPMYNYSVPSSLKAWLDQVTFPRVSLAPRRFVVASARGGAYGPGAPKERFDYQERFLRDFFHGHFGVEDTTFVHAELVNSRIDPSLASLRPKHDASLAAALETARTLAKDY
ncbi:FMN-dependent NADH-azoreductase [Actinomadura harenae]|uniref:FMN dependent NADH:quinone oxidoreductase n=1 Tax=Actinomadura harenae TaxID=2483351 RepID=A0A3M2LRY1_9ACTN|nr:NAD(P)H-dependent oxidoreductase [Actinomadura harenae]RMI40209.1 FMN-dependent NADH-azoreductase [Actinomadura harenae]